MIRTTLATLCLSALIAAPAFACSDQDLQAKALALHAAVKAASAKAPDSAADLRQKEIEIERLVASGADADAVCAAYDKAQAELEAAK